MTMYRIVQYLEGKLVESHTTNILIGHGRHPQMLNISLRKIRLAPWQVALAGMTSGAALFAAGAAFFRLLSP